MSSRPLILGHRGACNVAPENTLVAFRRAIEAGADGIEFDVRLSRDDVPVVIHDGNLKRTGLIDRSVRELTASELKQVDVGIWFDARNRKGQPITESFAGEKLPTLAKVFELFASLDGVLYVEMKCEPGEGQTLARQVVDEIRNANLAERVVVESFDLTAIVAIKEADTGIRTSALFEPNLRRPSTLLRKSRIIETAQLHKADELALHFTLATERLIGMATKAGMETVVWTVDNPAWIQKAQSLNVKALITNDPETMVTQRDKR